jgi:hypothetical protein
VLVVISCIVVLVEKLSLCFAFRDLVRGNYAGFQVFLLLVKVSKAC